MKYFRLTITTLIIGIAVFTAGQVLAATFPNASVFLETNDQTVDGDTAWHDVSNTSIDDTALTTAGINDGDTVLIIADINVEGSSASALFGFRIADTAGSAVANTTIYREPRTADTRNTWQRIITRTTKPTGEGFIFQKQGDASNSAHVHKFNMHVISLEDLTEGIDYIYNDDTSTTDIPANGSPATFASVTTPSGNSDWQTDILVMAHWTADVDANIDDSLIFSLVQDSGYEIGTTSQEAENVAEKWGGAFTWVFNQSDTSAHTYDVSLQNSDASTNSFDHAYSAIIAFPSTLFEDFEYAQTGTYMNSGTSFTEVAGITPFTPQTAGDFFISGSINSYFQIVTSDNEMIRIQVGGTDVPSGFVDTTEGAGSEVTSDIYNLSWSSIESLSGSTDIDLDAATDETPPDWGWRNLTAFSMEYTSLAESSPTPVEFVSIIDPDDGSGTDFTSLYEWEAVTQVDLTATSTMVFSHGGITGTIPDGSDMIGGNSGATASTTRVTASQILLYNIQGTFQSGEQIQVQGATGNYVVSADTGYPVVAVAECRSTGGTADTISTQIMGWSTDDDNYIKIWTNPDDEFGRHKGKWDNTKYRLEVADDYGLVTAVRHVRVDGLQIWTTDSDAHDEFTLAFTDYLGGTYYFEATNNIIRGNDTFYSKLGILAVADGGGGGSGSVVIANNIFFDFTGNASDSGIYLNNSGVSLNQYVFNNTVYNCERGIRRSSGSSYIYNNLVYNNTDNYVGSFSAGANNLSGPSSDADIPSTGAQNGVSVSFVDVTGYDFHLAQDDTGAKDLGTTSVWWMSSGVVQTDIDGTARGAAFDIGADEVPVEFVSTICENASAGGDCADINYTTLYDWEAGVEADLTATSTRVFGGSATGDIGASDALTLCNGSTYYGVWGFVVATTSDQILIEDITGTTSPVIAASGYAWCHSDCTCADDYWTITASNDDLGASPYVIAKIDGTWSATDTTAFEFDGWTTDQDNKVKIYTTNTARHDGKWKYDAYRIVSDDYYRVIRIRHGNIHIDGLQIENDLVAADASSAQGIGVTAGNGPMIISNNIIRHTGNRQSNGSNSGIHLASGDDFQNYQVYNNIVYNFHFNYRYIVAGSSEDNASAIFHNNTSYNAYYYGFGFSNYGTNDSLYLYNNLENSTTTSYYWWGTPDNYYHDKNIASDTSSPDNAYDSQTVSFVSTSTEDFHLASNDTAAKDQGIDLSSTSTLYFSTDIDSQERPIDEVWDIGADEQGVTKIYRSTGRASTNALQCGTATNDLTISGSIATLGVGLIDNIGVGDALVYNASSSIVFISNRTSSTTYTVKDIDGMTPDTSATSENDWCVFRAYTSLANAEAGIENTGIPSAIRNFDDWTAGGTAATNDYGRDLTESKEQWSIACYADAIDTTQLINQDWTANADYYLKIFTPIHSWEVGTTQRHNGVWDENKFILRVTNNNAVELFDQYTKIIGLQIDLIDNNGGSNAITSNTAHYIEIAQNILKNSSGKNYNYAIGLHYSAVANTHNNIIYDFLIGIYMDSHGQNYYYQYNNNTITDCYAGAYIGSSNTYHSIYSLSNNILVNNYYDLYSDGSNAVLDEGFVANNITSDDSGNDLNRSIDNQLNTQVKFWDPLSDDFHLHPEDIVAINAGTSTVSFDITNDLNEVVMKDIDSKPIHTFDIGADDASVYFTSSVMETGGDFGSLYAWEAANQVDLTPTSTMVFDVTTSIGNIPYNISVYGTSSGAVASTTLFATTTNQILLYNIASSTFEAGEWVCVLGTTNNCVQITDAGNYPIARAQIDGEWLYADTQAIDISGWTTGRYNYVYVYTTPTARHNGKWNDAKYRLSNTGNDVITIITAYAHIEGLQIEVDDTEWAGAITYYYDAQDQTDKYVWTVNNNIIKQSIPTNNTFGIDLSPNAEHEFKIFNNIVYGFSNGGICIYEPESKDHKIFNNTVYGCTVGIYTNYTPQTLVNNLVQNCTTDFYISAGADSASDYNISSDDTAPGSNSSTSTTVSFVDSDNGDFHLSPSDTAAIDNGTSTVFYLSGFNIATDIDETSRGRTPDIGADEVPTDFVSIICEGAGSGGDCADLDYTSVLDWEDAVETSIASGSTRVFSGLLTGSLSENDTVTLVFPSFATTSVTGSVVATTSDQILIDGITGTSTPIWSATGSIWRLDSSNYWTVQGTGDQLGASVIAVAKIDGTWSATDTDVIYLDGWGISYDNYIKIYTTNTARHTGKWSYDRYRTVNDGYDASVYAPDTGTSDYGRIIIDGLQIENTRNTEGGGVGILVENVPYSEFSNNIITQSGDITGNNTAGIGINGFSKIYNNIIYNYYKGLRFGTNDNARVEIYNNTIFNSETYGIDLDEYDGVTTYILKNNLVQNSGTADYNIGNGEIKYYNNNIASDTTSPNDSFDSTTVAFVSTSTNDFHLSSTDTSAKDQGSDVSASTTLFTTDIDGYTRPFNGTWDIGADEFVQATIYRSVGPSNESALQCGGGSNTLNITGSTATTSAGTGLANNIGVGDAIVYNASSSIVFISGRTSSTTYTVKDADGSDPDTEIQGNTDWCIFRAYSSLYNAERGDENDGLPNGVEDFDNWDGTGDYTDTDEVGRDLVTNNEIWNIACYGDNVDTDAVNIEDWTTGPNNYLSIYTPYLESEVGISQRHNGKWDDNKYHLDVTTASTYYAAISTEYDWDNYIRIKGLQIYVNYGHNAARGISLGNSLTLNNETYISHNIVKGYSTANDIQGVGIRTSNGNSDNIVYVWNNIVYGFIDNNNTSGTGINVSGTSHTTNMQFYNNTVYGCYAGFSDGVYHGGVVINNISQQNTYDYSGTFDEKGHTNISSDSTAPGNDSQTNTFVKFWNELGYDFHIHPEDTYAIDTGTSSVSSIVTTDIDGKPIHTYDIGADDASVYFESTVMESGGDFSQLALWESANDVDLTATSTMVFSVSSDFGYIQNGSSVYGTSSGAVASTTLYSTSTGQILLYNIASSTFESGEGVCILGTTNNCVTLSDAGNYAIATAKIDGEWSVADSNDFDINGWETGKYNYVYIYTTPAARHQGRWDNHKYRLDGNSAYGMIEIYERYAHIDGLQVANDQPIGNTPGGIWTRYDVSGARQGIITISNNVMKYDGNENVGWIEAGINIYESTRDYEEVRIYNNILYDWGFGIYVIAGSDIDRLFIYNNTVVGNNSDGISAQGSGDVYIINNLCQDSSMCYEASSYDSIVKYNNIASDDTADDDSGVNYQNSATVTFVDSDNNDYRLSPNDSTALNQGTTKVYYNQYFNIINDIDGTARGAVPDIGADEVNTEFVSTICESGAPDCPVTADYNNLYNWEYDLDDDITSQYTRVFSGTETGDIDDSILTLVLPNNATTSVTGYVHEVTSAGQLMLTDLTSTSTPAWAASGSKWYLDDSNYWTVQGTDDDLGASPIVVAKIDGSWTASDTVDVTFVGWTTDHDNYIKIYTSDTARHNGSWSTSAYTRTDIITEEDFIWFDGIQFDDYSPSFNVVDSYYSEIKFSNNIINNNNFYVGNSAAGNYKIWNNIIQNYSGSSAAMYIYSNRAYIYNNTIGSSGGFGIRSISGDIIAINNIVASTSDVSYYGTYAYGTDYNYSEDSDTPGIGLNNQTLQTFNFVSTTPGSEDYHLLNDSASVVDGGFDITSSSTLNVISEITADIDGDTRPKLNGWDAGADEYGNFTIYRSVGPSNTSAIQCGTATNDLTISASTATFGTGLANNIGVGDAIVYNASSSIIFISGRTSSTTYEVQDSDGTSPSTSATSETDWCVFRAYTSLYYAERGNENNGIPNAVEDFDNWDGTGDYTDSDEGGRDLVTNKEVWNIACYGDAVDTSAVTISGWTSDSDNYLKVYTPYDTSEVGVSQRHNGKWDTSKYTIEATNPNATIDNTGNTYMRVDGLQIGIILNNNTDYHGAIYLRGAPEFYFSNNIVRGNISGTSGTIRGVGMASAGTVYLWNNIIYDFVNGDNYLVAVEGSLTTGYIYNNTIYNCNTGIYRASGVLIARNNLTQNCNNGFNGSISSTLSDNNISDIDGDAVNLTYSTTAINVKFWDEVGKDFHIHPEDTSGAIDGGTSTVSSVVTTDIDDKTVHTYDIGADDASVYFESTVMVENGDFSTLYDWEAANQVDLTSENTLTFNVSADTGYIPNGTQVYGATSDASAYTTLYSTTTGQILLYNVSGNFQSGEEVCIGSGEFAVTREQYDTDSNTTASATFGSTPTEGNLLVAITTMRVGEDVGPNTASISGSGWTRVINDHFKTNSSTSDRRGLAMFYKIAEAGEPTNIQTSWNPSGTNNLIIAEYSVSSGSFSFDTATSTNSGVSSVTSLTSGTTDTSASANNLIVTGFASRNDTGAVTWTNDVGDNIYYYANTIGAQSGFGTSTTQETKESTASWATTQITTAGIAVFTITGAVDTNNCVTISNDGNYAIATAKIDGVWTNGEKTSSELIIGGWDTSKYNGIRIYTTPVARHQGKWSNNRYYLQRTTDSTTLELTEDYVSLEGLQITTSDTNGETWNDTIEFTQSLTESDNHIYIDQCYLKAASVASGDGIQIPATYNYINLTVTNSIISGFDSEGIYVQGSAAINTNKIYFYNNTIYNCYTGLAPGWGGYISVYNNAVFGNTDDFENTGLMSIDSNASDDGDGTNAITPSNWSSVFTDYANGDFTLRSTDSELRDQGTTTYHLHPNTNHDINGTTRGAVPDIGADEVNTEFVSTICETTGSGGDCINLDYHDLSTWEAGVDSDLTSAGTRVFGGYISGSLDEDDTVTLVLPNFATTSITGSVVATTSDQILIDGIIGSSTPIWAATGSRWSLDNSNYWNIGGTGDELGASPIAIAKIDGSWNASDTHVYLSSWVTDHDNYIKIYTTNTARHNGVWSNTKYRIYEDYAYSVGIDVKDVIIDGLQIKGHQSNAVDGIRAISSIDYNFTLSNNIIDGSKNVTNSNYGIRLDETVSGYRTAKILNNIIYDWGYQNDCNAIYCEGDWDHVYLYNNTIFNTYRGIRADGTVIAINNIVSSSTNAYDRTFAYGTDYNYTDSSDTIGVGDNNQIDQTFDFIDINNYNFHLTSESSTGVDVGFDITSSSTLNVISGITSDIDGNARPALDGWDVGADEYALYTIYRSVGPSNTSAIQCSTGANGLTISGSTATISAGIGLADNIGVGDAIVYNASSSIVFISGRTSSTTYTVKDADGTDPDTTASSDTGWCVFRAYTSLYAAERGNENDGLPNAVEDFDNWDGTGDYTDTDEVGRDLVSNNEIWNIACYGDNTDSDGLNIENWTTGANNTLNIYTPVKASEVGITQRHNSKWDSNKYNLAINDEDDVIRIMEPYVTIDGLQLKNSSYASDYLSTLNISGASDITNVIIKNNILKDEDRSGNYHSGINTGAEIAAPIYVYNNIIYGFNNNGIEIDHDNGTFPSFVYNNTVYDCATGIDTQYNEARAINNLVVNCDYSFDGSFDTLSDYNITDSSDAMDVLSGGGSNNQINIKIKFWDEVDKDFHLHPEDTSGAIDGGTSTVSSIVSSDIDGKPIRTYDIGADDASVYFESTVMESGGDFSSLYSWEQENQVDLTATSTMTFTCATVSGTWPFGANVVGTTSGAVASSTVFATSSSQILLYNIASSTFQTGEKVIIQGDSGADNYCILADAGNYAIATAKIDGVWNTAETSEIYIDGWETGTYNQIKIYTTPTTRHRGKWSNQAYVLTHPANTVLSVYESNVIIDGLQIFLDSTQNAVLLESSSPGTHYVTNNIIRGQGTSGGALIFHRFENYSNSVITNNILYDAEVAFVSYPDADLFLNNTIYDVDYGVYALSDGITLKNNLANNTLTQAFYNDTSWGSDDDYNISDDNSAPGPNSSTSTTVSFINASDDDFRLSTAETTAINGGAVSVYSLTPYIYTDIDGTTRGAVPDIGADEVNTEFVSTICETTGSGGDCINLDYHDLSTWEAGVDSDLTSAGTRVFGGNISGSLDEDDTVTLVLPNFATTTITGSVVATTSDQILIDGIIGSSTPVWAATGSRWSLDNSNYWNIGGTGDALGASPIAVAKIDGSWNASDTNALLIYDWTTDFDNYIKIYTTDTARHNGVWDYNKYRLVNQTSMSLNSWESNVTIDGLQIYKDHSTANNNVINFTSLDANTSINISNNIIRADTVSSGWMVGIRLDDPDIIGAKIYNNIVYDILALTTDYGVAIADDSGNKNYIYNNTIYNCARGINSAESIAINNLIASTTNPYVGTFAYGTDYNYTDHATDDPGEGSNNQNNQTFNFVDIDNYDLHLATESSTGVDMGFDITSSSTLNVISGITSDIDGNGRPALDGWDVGADEYAIYNIYRSVGPSNTSAIQCYSGSDALTISGSVATFPSGFGLADNIGVGDAIVYNASSSIVFISGRTSSTTYSVKDADGTGPDTTASSDTGWCVFRAYTALSNAIDTTLGGTENTGIPLTVRDFDSHNGDRDIVTNKEIWHIACYGDNGGEDYRQYTNTEINGWTTSETNYISIFTPYLASQVGTSQRHTGKWDDSKYYLKTDGNGSSASVITIDNVNNVRVDGMQIFVDCANCIGTSRNALGIYFTGGSGEVYISNNIIKGENIDVADYGRGIMYIPNVFQAGTETLYAYNNIIYDFRGPEGAVDTDYAGIRKEHRDAYQYIYNNTVINCNNGYSRAGSDDDMIIMNSIAQDTNVAFYDVSASGDYNIADDGTAPGSNSQNNITLKFWDKLGDDFHLSPDDSAAIDTATSAASSIFTKDIDNKTIHTYDIGADDASVEFVSTVMESGGDFPSLYQWEVANQVDLTATTTMVFDVSAYQGFIQPGANVYGTSSFAVASTTLFSTTSMQILLYNIASSTFISGERVCMSGTTDNCVTLSDAGNYAHAVAKIDGAWTSADANYVNITGWETGKYNRIKIYTTATARHNGKWDNSKYRLTNDGDVLAIRERHSYINGLQVQQWGTGNYREGINYIRDDALNPDAYHTLSNCIVTASTTATEGSVGITAEDWDNGHNINIYNNIVYGFSNYGIFARTNGIGDVNISNNTVYDIGVYAYYLSRIVPRNNICQNSGTCYYTHEITYANNNISDDNTAPGANSQTNATVTFIDESAYDFRLMPEDTAARDQGSDLIDENITGTTNDMRFDAAGNTRYDAKWDIGALEGPTILYRSVGNDTRNLATSTATVTIATTTATFSSALPDNVGVGDVLQYGGSGYYQLAFITARASSTEYEVQARDGSLPTATTSASVNIYRAHQYLNYWDNQDVDDVNTSIDSSVDDLVLLPSLDLTASNTTAYVPCYASTSADNSGIDLATWTTATTSLVKLYTPVSNTEVGISQRHSGVWDDTKYRVNRSYTGGSYIELIDINDDFAIVEGLQIRITASSSGGITGIRLVGDGEYTIKNNILFVTNSDSDANGIHGHSTSAANSYIFNNIIQGVGQTSGSVGIRIYTTRNAYLYNNTVSGWQTGVNRADGTGYAYNNVVFDNTDDFNSPATTIDYNASDDGDGTNAVSLGSSTAIWAAAFTDYANGDFSIKSQTSPLYNAGTTITIVEDDIIGTPRPYENIYDIGAFEYTGKARYRFDASGSYKMQGTIKFR